MFLELLYPVRYHVCCGCDSYESDTKGHSGSLGLLYLVFPSSHRLRAGFSGKLSQPVTGTYHRRERHSRAGSLKEICQETASPSCSRALKILSTWLLS